MDTVAFPYRSAGHLALLHVVSESGSWAKHGLKVNYDYQISSTDAHDLVPKGEVEFVGGNHVSSYAYRARGDTWVYLGQTLNQVNVRLVVRPDSGINGVADLREKIVATSGSHPSLNDWLYLKQRGLDVDRDDVILANKIQHKPGTMDPIEGDEKKKKVPLWHDIRDKKADAAFLTAPASLLAEEAGLKAIDIPPQPMIWFTTVSSSLGFVEKHPDIVERFLKGLIEGIHFFKTQREKTIDIIEKRYNREGPMTRVHASFIYDNLGPYLEPKLYPSMAAIANVYEEAKRQDADANKINPLELWDMHHVRRIDDSGFINALYSGKPQKPAGEGESSKIDKKELVKALKTCGHLETESCGCA
jgi:ABC-type nitrate/sulfonate/bicarbonate transport system substrate-binding protein